MENESRHFRKVAKVLFPRLKVSEYLGRGNRLKLTEIRERATAITSRPLDRQRMLLCADITRKVF